MADYKIHLGVKLNTSDINTQISKYKASPIDIKANLDTNGITKAINSYKSKPISIDSKLNTDGITEKIRAYTPPKKIHLESDLSTAGIDKKINNYVPKKPIVVDVELDKSSINQQIANAKPTQSIIVNAELKKSAISEAIRSYKSTTPIKVMVDPDFDRVDAVIKNYIPRNLLKVNIKLNKGEIDSQIKNFQTSTKIEVGAKLRDNAIEKAIRTYAGKELVPITVDFKVGETREITNKINEYKNQPVSIPVKLRPAQTGFDSEITKKPVRVQATLDPDGIDSVIDKFNPTSRIKVGVKLDSKDINGQVAKLPKPTDPIDVDVRLNSNSINNAITKFTPTSRLKVGVDLKTDDINQQIDAIHPTSEIKVDVNLDNSDINTEIGRQNTQTPITVNVKLDRNKLNEQIRTFKTQTKLKVGVKLDFASHEGGQKGVPQQIKDYKTKSKIKVGVQLDKDSIAQEVSTVKSDTPIKLGVELDPEDINKIKGQVSEIKQQIEALGNVRINLGGSNVGATTGSGSSVGTGTNTRGTGIIRDLSDIAEADIKIQTTMGDVKALQEQLSKIGFGQSAIDTITEKFDNLDVAVKRVSTRLYKDGSMTLTINGVDEAKRAVTEIYEVVGKNDVTPLSKKVTQNLGETERFIKQQENAVARLTNQINEANRKAIDPNANHSIKEQGHLNELEAQYKAIIDAIQQMGNASSDTFNAEKNRVEALISEYKSLVSEYRNAENISIDYDGNDYSTGLETAKNKLIEFKREAKEFPQMAQTVRELDDAFEKIGDTGSLQDFTRQLGVADSALKNIQAEANEANRILTDAWKKIESLSMQTARLNPEANPKQLAELSKQLEEAEADYESLKRAFSSKLSTSQFGTLQVNADDLGNKLDAIEAKYQDTRAELAKKISIHLEAGKFTEQVTRAYSNANRLADTSQELKVKLEALHNAQTDMNNAFKSDNVDEQIAAYRRYLGILEDVNNQIKINKTQERDAVDAQKLTLSKQGLSSDMTSWLRDNSVAAKRFGDDIRRLQAQLETCDNSVDFNNIKAEFRNVQKEAKALGLTGLTTFDKLKYKLKEYMAYFSVAEVFMYASQGLRDMFEQVKAIDSAMTELKKVTNETDAAYSQFLENAASRAKEIGTTIDGLVSSTADFARLGYGFEDAQGLAEVANIYAVVGDEIEGVEGATESLISTMAAFKDEMNGMSNTDFAMSIIDKFNEIGNNFSISSGGIGEALERSASSLMAANNTIDESIALITAANTVVQSPDAVGTAFKTISMRIRGAKTELEEAGLETDGMVSSTAKLREEILALSGVDIMENANEFKSTYKIMDELAVKWKDLTDIQQASITELIAGKRQGNIVSSLMQNFDTAREALETSLNSSGSALEEHEKWQKSLEAQTLKLEAAWQSLSQTFMSSKFLHGALDAVIGLVDGIETLIDTLGTLPTLALAFTAFQSFKGQGFFRVIEDEAAASGKRVATIFGTTASSVAKQFNAMSIKTNPDFRNSLNQDCQALSRYRLALRQGMSTGDAFNKHLTTASQAAQQYAKSGQLAAKGIRAFATQQRAAQVTMVAQNNNFSSAKALMNEYNSGCKNTALAQTDFVDAVKAGNSGLGKYLSGLNGAKATMRGYITSLVASKAATIALEAATIALNAALTMGISFAIQAIITIFDKLIVTNKELAESVEEVTTKFKEEHNELRKLKNNYDTSNESSMISKYEKLSKGVDGLGKNVSLTAEEYSEYQSIVNQIADQIPSLVSGYDSQGNALLSCKGNVEELTKAYEKLIHAQNQEILTNTKDIEKDFANIIKDSEKGSFLGMGKKVSAPSIELLEKALNGNYSADEIKKLFKGLNAGQADGVYEALYSANIGDMGRVYTYTEIAETLAKQLEEDPSKIKGIIDDYYAQFDSAIQEYKTIAQAKLSEAFDVSSVISGIDYGNITEELQNLAYQTVNSLDYDFFTNLQEQGKSLEQWTTEFLNQLNTIGKVNGETIKSAFELQTQFNGGDINYGDYVKKLRTVEETINKLNLKDEAKTQLKISLGLDENGVVDQYDALVKRLTSKEIGLSDSTARNFVNSLSAEELSVLVDIVPNLDAGTTLKEIQSLIDDQLAEEFKFDIEVQTKGIEALNTALAESRSAAGLTSESIEALTARYEDLDGFNAAALFEKTANGIRLNSDELSRLEEQYVNTNKLEIDKNLNTLVEKYQDVNNELKTNTSLTADERKELENSKKSLADKIDELSTLASQYDGLTSAFTKWQNALDGAEEGDNYDSVFENLEAMKELDDKGLVGTDKYKTFAQLMSYNDLSTASIDEISKAFDKGYKKAERYFTEGQKGSKNFLKDLNAINSEWAHINKDGVWEVDINAEEAAKKLGISVEAVLLLLDKLKDYGIKVEVDDTSVNGLKTKIQETEAKLKELGQSPVDINVDIEASSSNLGKIESEIDKAKSKIAEINNSSVSPEVKTAQLEDARAKLETLIQKKQEASQPAFMNLNTSQVNASLVDALDKIKEYQNALNELNKLKELKDAGIAIDDSEIDSAQKKIDDCAKAIQGLDGDVKVAIGLEEDGSIDSIKKAFEEGKVKIDANTDPALTKVEQLAENVERIEDKDVTINVTVNGLDQVKELNKQIDLATDIKGDIDKLSEYVENAKELNKLGNNITSYVTAEVKGNVIDTKEYKLDNLKVFGESAKEVKGLGTFTSKVTADVEGNVIDTREGKLDNLKVFTDSAKDIKEFEGNIISNITANTLGSVFTDKERNIDNLKVFVDSAKGIKEIEGNITSNITANTLGSVFENKSEEKYIDNLKTFIDSSKGIRDIEGNIVSNITANTLGSVFENKNEDKYIDNLKTYIDSAKGIKDIEGNIISSITANTLGSVFENKNEDKYIDNLKTYVDSAKGIKNIEGNIVSNITANTLGSVFTDSERTTDNLKTFIESANGIKDIEGDIVSNITANTLGSVFNDKERSIDNLKVFIESAKGIKDIEGNIVSNITANTLGDVFTDKERSIDNLKVFTESAKGIKEIEGDIVSNITANTLGSVFTNPERETNNLKVFIESAKGIKDIEGDIVSNITANTLGSVFTDKERSIDNLKVFINSAKGIKEIEGNISSNITANVSGNVLNTKENKIDNLKVFSDSAKDVKNVGSPTSNVTANVNGNVINTSEDKIDNLGVFATNANKLKNTGNFTSSVSANVSGNVITDDSVNSDLEHFASIVSGMSSQTVTVSVNAKVDSANINNAIDLLTRVANSGVFKDYKATVQVGAKIATIDDTTVKNYKAPKKDGKVAYTVDSTAVDAWNAPSKDGVVNYSASVETLTDAQKHKTGTITYKAKITGFPVVNGTANANGSAFANGTSGKAFKQGDWGVKKTTTALTGELGQELVVYKNRWYTVGDNGAEFATIPKGAIVFNHKQTEELFRNGKVTSDGGRGRALANGTAFTSGTAFEGGSGMPKDETDTDKFEEIFDWIDTLLSRLERTIDNLDKTVNNTFKSWKQRNDALENEIGAVGKEKEYQSKAAKRYLKSANMVGLDDSWKEKVRNGTLDISTVTDEDTAEKIKEYQKWYELYLDCIDKAADLKQTEAELWAQRFDNVVSEYEGILQGFEHTESMLNEYISQAEAKGHIVSKNYYQALIDNERSNIAELQKEQTDLIAKRDEAVASGAIVKGSQAWYDMCAEIDGVTQAIEEGTTALIEYDNAIRDIEFEVFELTHERMSQLSSEAEFLIELMSNKKLHNDDGSLTNEGMATMGLLAQNYNQAMYEANDYGAKAADIARRMNMKPGDEGYEEEHLDPLDQNNINKYNEYLELQRESILNAEDQKQAIKDLIAEGYEKELDALQEKIDKTTEALDSQKDLYDYQKQVKEQSEEIAALEKQRAAYLSDTSAEGRAKLQEITVSLKEAKESLEETEFDRYLSQQEELLSSLYDEYELILNTRLDDLDGLVADVITEVNSSATTISDTLIAEAENVGTALSDAMKGIWNGEGGDNIKSVLSSYGDKITGESPTSLANVLNGIKNAVDAMVDDVDKEAETKVGADKTDTSANADPTGNKPTKKPQPPKKTANKSTGGDGKPKIGDKVKFLNGKYYYDSQGVNPAGSKNHGKQVYITNINKKSWATHPYHISTGKKLGSGDLGWLKLNQISGYATGKKNFLDDEIAWTQENGQEFIVRPSDGAILTPIAKGDSVLTSAASSNIWDMANSPTEFIKDNLNLGTTNVPNNSSVNNHTVQNFENIVFSMPNVRNYNEMLEQMQKDPKFDKLVKAISIDQIAGKSSLAKNKSIR